MILEFMAKKLKPGSRRQSPQMQQAILIREIIPNLHRFVNYKRKLVTVKENFYRGH